MLLLRTRPVHIRYRTDLIFQVDRNLFFERIEWKIISRVKLRSFINLILSRSVQFI